MGLTSGKLTSVIGTLGAFPGRAAEKVKQGASRLRGGDDVAGLADQAALEIGSFVDKAILTVMKGPGRYPKKSDYERLQSEMTSAHALYAERGYLTNPASFHPAPHALNPEIKSAKVRGLEYDWLSFPSEYTPDFGDVAGQRWLKLNLNRTAHAWVMRHDDASRPWVICMHGLGTGDPWLDFPAFRAATMHYSMGYNLLFPVMPLHGPRRDAGVVRGSLLSFDLLNTLHGIRQAVLDTRRLIGWVRAQGGNRIGLYGQSMGAYTAALIATLEDVDAIMAGIPLCDIPDLFFSHTTPAMRETANKYGMFDQRVKDVYRLISPLELPVRVPHHRRFIFAGLGDRITTPDQARRLWDAWGRPSIEWYHGGHVSFFWSGQVDGYVERSMRTLEEDRDSGLR